MHRSPERSRQIADLVLAYERMIADANGGKADIWEAVREELRQDGIKGADAAADVAQLKAAVAAYCRAQLDPLKAEKAELRQAGAEQYLEAINMVSVNTAPSRTHVHVHEGRSETIPTTGSPQAAASDVTGPRPGADAAATEPCGSGDGATVRTDRTSAGWPVKDLPAAGSAERGTADRAPGEAEGNAASPDAENDKLGPQVNFPTVVILAKRVASDPEICDGAPIVAGTRIQTSTIRQYADDGWQADGIIQEYPELTQLDVAAALQFEAMERAKETAARPAGVRRSA